MSEPSKRVKLTIDVIEMIIQEIVQSDSKKDYDSKTSIKTESSLLLTSTIVRQLTIKHINLHDKKRKRLGEMLTLGLSDAVNDVENGNRRIAYANLDANLEKWNSKHHLVIKSDFFGFEKPKQPSAFVTLIVRWLKRLNKSHEIQLQLNQIYQKFQTRKLPDEDSFFVVFFYLVSHNWSGKISVKLSEYLGIADLVPCSRSLSVSSRSQNNQLNQCQQISVNLNWEEFPMHESPWFFGHGDLFPQCSDYLLLQVRPSSMENKLTMYFVFSYLVQGIKNVELHIYECQPEWFSQMKAMFELEKFATSLEMFYAHSPFDMGNKNLDINCHASSIDIKEHKLLLPSSKEEFYLYTNGSLKITFKYYD